MFNFNVQVSAGQATLFVEGGLTYSINFDQRGLVSQVILDGWVIREEVVFY
jgi:hypothetical protein